MCHNHANLHLYPKSPHERLSALIRPVLHFHRGGFRRPFDLDFTPLNVFIACYCICSALFTATYSSVPLTNHKLCRFLFYCTLSMQRHNMIRNGWTNQSIRHWIFFDAFIWECMCVCIFWCQLEANMFAFGIAFSKCCTFVFVRCLFYLNDVSMTIRWCF